MARKIVVASGKGGVGKTTLTIGLGKALAAGGARVLLVDFDNLRAIDLMLGAAGNVVFDWGDVVQGRCAPEDAILQQQGVSFLACPPSYDGVTPQQVRDLIGRVEAAFDYVLFDAPAGIGTGLQLAAAAAQRALVVATPDLVCVRSACRAAQELEKQGVKSSRLVINRAARRDIRRRQMLNIDDVIDATGVQLIAIIPEDKRLRSAGMEGGVCLPGQISREAFLNLAKRVQGKNVPLMYLFV
jgi:septum site-determining protein MinD